MEEVILSLNKHQDLNNIVKWCNFCEKCEVVWRVFTRLDEVGLSPSERNRQFIYWRISNIEAQAIAVSLVNMLTTETKKCPVREILHYFCVLILVLSPKRGILFISPKSCLRPKFNSYSSPPREFGSARFHFLSCSTAEPVYLYRSCLFLRVYLIRP